MGNCKKQDSKRPELDINELFKRIKFESKQIQKIFRDIEGLLKRSQKLMQRLQITRNNSLVNGNTFFDVAEAPAVPTPAPPPTPTPQAPVTAIQQTLINNILSTAREIGRVRTQIRNTVEAYIGGLILLRRRFRQLRGAVFGGSLEGATLEEIALGLLVLQSQLENLTLQLEGLQEDLDINISLLANTVL
ncbi:hypothetical protein [Priestia megaterium]|uniref:hypothetical protein n=1 Tax=Priestia megaterium TaxID=1404 RepID=UPI002FFFA007